MIRTVDLNPKVSTPVVLIIWSAAVLLAGCQRVPQFPLRPMRAQLTSDGSTVLSFDTNKDKKPDYWQKLDASGRKVELTFAADGQKPRQSVPIDELDAGKMPHFIIALDGVPYQLVKDLHDQGGFRLFYRPSRVVSTFPSMTDLAFQQLFGGAEPMAYEAKYFDRRKNRLIEGTENYISGQAADWCKTLDYRGSFLWDGVAYIYPQPLFEHELQEIMKIFRQTTTGTKKVYLVATAGLGTREGREGILKYLRVIDRLCEQIVYERRGRVKITLLADHGHNMSGRGRVTFGDLLHNGGYHLTDRLEEPNDVVTVEYGLVTYAAFYCVEPAGVARTLLEDPVVTLACYPQADAVVVQDIDGKALIRQAAGRYSYTVEKGDPLRLLPIVEQLRQQGKIELNGFIDDEALFQATLQHIYPDPLRRVWRAFHGLVAEPADMIICLKDGWVHGSSFFNAIIGGATSTHGSLNQINSMTFALTMWGQLPPALRIEDVMPALQQLEQARIPGPPPAH